tara:strand:+ start:32 stop:391 length:360 start_codon:yes stop_codon:yes gene_type:complete
MKRYDTTPKKTDKSGARVYSTTFYPEIPIRDTDIFITSVFGQRLENLAYKYYGDTSLWWIISKANGIRGQMGLKPGTLLRIPQDVTRIIENFNNINEEDIGTSGGGISSTGGGGTGGGY